MGQKKNGGKAAKQEKVVGAPVKGRPRKVEKSPETAGVASNGHKDTLVDNLGESSDKFPAKRPRKDRSEEDLVKRELEKVHQLVEVKTKEREAELHKLSEEQWNFAHLALEAVPENLLNPFDEAIRLYDDPAKQLLHVMMNPDYFGWATTKLLNTANNHNGLELLPFQCVILRELWNRSFPILLASRGASKSSLLAIYSLLRCLFLQGRKVVITGSSFRQSKIILSYAETIWYNSPILRDICGANKYKSQGPHHDNDVWKLQIGESIMYGLPLGSGDKIRGMRAHDVIADEMACLGANTLVETDRGLIRIADSFNEKNFKVFTGEGDNLENPSQFIKTPLTDVYRIRTKGNYEFKCSSIHKVETTNGWKLSKDLKNTDFLVFNNTYKFPEKYLELDGVTVDENVAWLMGILVSEGSINDRYSMDVNMADKDCIDRIYNSWKFLDPSLNPGMQYRKAYIDPRGWKCKETWRVTLCNVRLREIFVRLGLSRSKAINKIIPWSILQSPKSVVVAFLSSLFHGDGSCSLKKSGKINDKLVVSYSSISEQLCIEIQILLKKLNIFCSRTPNRGRLSNNIQWKLTLQGDQAYNFATIVDIPKWNNMISKCYIPPFKKKWWTWFNPGMNKWQTTARRYGKYEYIGCYNTYKEAELAANSILEKTPEHILVKSVELLPDKDYLYDYHIPISHAFMGNCFRQHNSINPEVFETVVALFGVVNIDPISNIKHIQRLKYIDQYQIGSYNKESMEDFASIPNQIILSGTASYTFNHFYKYWKEYKEIIMSQGDPEKKTKAGISPDIDHKRYSIFRIPVALLPEGLMAKDQLARSKQMQSVGTSISEFHSCFASDSTGFFRRSIIERAMPSPTNPVVLPTGTEINTFPPLLKGDPNKKYIMAIDTASQRDNFAIVILELHADHARIVHCWTSNAQRQLELRQSGLTNEKDFYAYCTQKIRELLKLFNIVHIAMDAQGGGYTIINSLHSGEPPIWELNQDSPLWSGKESPTDDEKGLHIVELVQFTQQEYTGKANHGLKDDLERRTILFPYVDDISYILAGKNDIDHARTSDTLEEVLWEMDQLKDELTIIQVSTTPSGREHWGAPRIKENVDRPGELHDDRYSALLMANYAARRLREIPEQSTEYVLGGFTGTNTHIFPAYAALKDQPLYVGPSWFTNKIGDFYGTGVNGVEEGR